MSNICDISLNSPPQDGSVTQFKRVDLARKKNQNENKKSMKMTPLSKFDDFIFSSSNLKTIQLRNHI